MEGDWDLQFDEHVSLILWEDRQFSYDFTYVVALDGVMFFLDVFKKAVGVLFFFPEALTVYACKGV